MTTEEIIEKILFLGKEQKRIDQEIARLYTEIVKEALSEMGIKL